MQTHRLRLRPQIAAACLALCLGIANAAVARPVQLDDLLRAEDLGQAAIAPDGRWLVIETLAPYSEAGSFDFAGFSQPNLGRLMVADLNHPGPAQPLLPQAADAGYIAGPFSPKGRSMIVYRFRERIWDTGVVDLTTRQVRWLGIATERAAYGRTLQWRSETELVLIALPDGAAPIHLRVGWQAMDRLPDLWGRTRAGREPAVSISGSGRFLERRTIPKPRRLLKVDVRSGAVQTLASGGFFDLELSSTGRYLAAVADAEPIPLPLNDQVRVGTPTRRRDLVVVDLATATVRRPCETCDLIALLLAWSPTDDRLLVFARKPDQAWTAGSLLAVDAVTGGVAQVGKGLVAPEVAYDDEGIANVRADWMGADPIVYGRVVGEGGQTRSDWLRLAARGPVNLTRGLPQAPPQIAALEPDGLSLVADGAAWRVEAMGRSRRLAGGLGLRPQALPQPGLGGRFKFNAPPRQEWVLARSSSGVERIRKTGALTSFPLSDGATPMAQRGDRIAVRLRDGRGVQQVVLMSPNRPPQTLLTVNAAFGEIDPAPLRPIHHKGPNGEALTSWLYLPGGRPSVKPPPLIVLPYPGKLYATPPARYAAGAINFTPNAQLLAAQGYAVLVPSLPRAENGEPAAGLADQILQIVDLIAAEGLIDPNRLAMWGHSFGGYAALVTATQTGRFKAIIAQAGAADLISGWGSIPPHYRAVPEDGHPTPLHMGSAEGGQVGLGAPPWADLDRYVRNSPVFEVEKITSPILLLHGDQDFVTLGQAEEMFAALYRQDKDAMLMTLWGEGHIPASPANLRAIYAEVLSWLDLNLTDPAEINDDRARARLRAPTSAAPSAPRPEALEDVRSRHARSDDPHSASDRAHRAR